MAKNKDYKEAAENEEAMTNEEEETEEAGSADTTDTAMVRITAGLPAEVVKRVQTLLASMDPNKPGFEEMGGARWSPPLVKVHQPTSGDAPGNSKQGDLYTNAGDMLTRPFEFIPVYMHYSHARFEAGNNNPTCSSEDGKTSRYGDVCKDCPDFPFRDGQKTACNKAIDVYAFNKDCAQLYHMQFAKTSYKAGTKLYRQASVSAVPWARVYAADTEKKQRQNDTGIYYVMTVTPTGDQSDTALFPLIEYVYNKICMVRKQVLARVEARVSPVQKVVDNLPTDFGGTPPDGGKSGAGQPDFSDM